MKLHTDRNDVERSNVGAESSFRIKTTAKAFDILSSGLYTDRILAVVRELSCNAYDAHVAAGNHETPFEIHVPNSLEPWFHVKDFGTGLSDEDVMNLYSTYFDSTKTTSNDFIGALGLGSKSPFSYTKAFEVISRFEHVRRTYSVFINEDGVPTIAKMGEFVTDEPNGLEVRIAVKKDDFWTFQDKIRAALRWFPVKPNIVGTTHFEWLQIPKESLSGEGWRLFDDSFSNNSKMTAVQGNVAYKVDITKLELDKADQNLLENAHIVGFFEIGDLEVAASREEIRYDDRSSKALYQKIKDVRWGILTSVEEKIKALEASGATFWTIMMHLNEMADDMFNSRSLFTEFLEPSEHESIKRYLTTHGKFILPELKGHGVVGYMLSTTSSPEKASVKRTTLGSGIEPEKNIVVFLNDMKTGGIAKITHFLRTNACTSRIAIVINRFDKPHEFYPNPDKTDVLHPMLQATWTDEQFEEEYEQIINSLGNVEVKLASTDAPLPPRARSEYKSIPIFTFEGVNVRRYGKSSIVWNRVPADQLDFTKDALYFFIRNGSHITVVDAAGTEKDVTWNTSQTKEYLQTAIKMINDAQGTKFTLSNVYAVGSMAAKKVKKLSNWVNLFDALKTQMSQFQDAVRYFKRVQQTDDVMGLRDVVIGLRPGSKTLLTTGLAKLSKKSKFRTTLEPLIEDAAKYQLLQTTCNFMQKLDVDLGTKVFDTTTPKGYYGKHAFDDYPMLSFVSQFQYLTAQQVKLFFDYIETIDRS